MSRLLAALVLAGLAGIGVFWVLTAPERSDPAAFAGLAGDPAAGEAVFWAAGCASCHAAPESEDKLVLAGGERFPSDFGTFVAPNISTDPVHGIGAWSLEQFATALTRGVSPDGRHYYPAFPYGAYALMRPQDIADLKAFMDTLPASDTPSQPHEVGFPFTLRRGLGLWKMVSLDAGWTVTDPLPDMVARGRYLAEALGHCAECHTPRNAIGTLDRSRWMAGAPDPSGKGRVPGLTPDTLDWSAEDIAYYLETGFTPAFDSAGGLMSDVVANFGRLTPEDRAAVAAYVKALPAAE